MTSTLKPLNILGSLETIVNNNDPLSTIELINELRNIIKNHENEEKKKEEERIEEIFRKQKQVTVDHFREYNSMNKDLIIDNKPEDESAKLYEFFNESYMREGSCSFTFTQKAIKEGYDRINYSDIVENSNWTDYFHFSQPLKIGDIIDTGGISHIGWRFVGENNTLFSAHLDIPDYEEGTTVPIEITRMYMDTIAIYQKEVNQENENEDETKNKKEIKEKTKKYEEKFPAIYAYELPFWDITVKKYDVPKNSKFFFTYEYLYYVDNKWHMYVRSVDNPYEKVEVKLKNEHVQLYFEDDEDISFEDIKEIYSN